MRDRNANANSASAKNKAAANKAAANKAAASKVLASKAGDNPRSLSQEEAAGGSSRRLLFPVEPKASPDATVMLPVERRKQSAWYKNPSRFADLGPDQEMKSAHSQQ